MGNIFNKLLNFEGSPWKKDQSVIGLDIGSSAVKVIQLKQVKGRIILETYGALALGPYADLSIGQAVSLPPDEISAAIKDLFKESNITTNNSGVSIPMKSTLISLIEMPPMDARQLAEMIPLEARKYIPVPISEVALDWQIVPKISDIEENEDEETPKEKENGRDKLNILIVAIHNEILKNYQAITQSIGLVVSFFEVEIFSTIRSTFSHDMTPTMVLDMGAGTTKLSVVERGVVQSFHTINRGSQDITLAISKSMGVDVKKAESLKREIGIENKTSEKNVSDVAKLSVGYIFDESNRVLLNYQRKYNKTISKVILTGGGVLLKGFLQDAKEHLETDVVFGDPFAKVEAPAFLEPVLKEAGPEFAVAIGLALRKLQEK